MNTFKITLTLLALLCAAVFAQQKGTFKDPRDGKTYKTAKVGEQTWIAENLNYDAKGSQCYDNKPDNCAKYGRLYNWETAKEVCPAGWRLPSNTEGEKLFGISGNFAGISVEALASKLGSETYTALLGGYNSKGKFTEVLNSGSWWTTNDVTADGPDKAISMLMTPNALSEKYKYSKSSSRRWIFEKSDLLSVLCIQGAAGSAADIGSFTDSRDNRKYKTLRIGSLNWMAENLDYNAKDSKCYDDKPDNCKKLGRLYDWETAMRTCPAGWHLPTGPEWAELEDIAGGKSAGTMLKSKSDWKDYGGKSGNGTDKVGFTALPGGKSYARYTITNGKAQRFVVYEDYGYAANFWYAKESVEYLSGHSVALRVSNRADELSWEETGGTGLYSVRCVQGEAGAEAKAIIAKIEAKEKEAAKQQPKQAEQKQTEPPKQQPQPQPKQQPQPQPKQQTANENCSITFPKKACVSVPKGSCGMMGGKVVAKCP